MISYTACNDKKINLDRIIVVSLCAVFFAFVSILCEINLTRSVPCVPYYDDEHLINVSLCLNETFSAELFNVFDFIDPNVKDGICFGFSNDNDYNYCFADNRLDNKAGIRTLPTKIH